MWEGSWVDQNKAGSFLVGCFLMCCCPGESYSWSRPWASTWLPPRLPLPSLQLKHQLSSPKRPEEGSLDFLAFNSNGKKPWPLPGMEWAGLSPKCKCHFSTSLVTTPFLAFIGNDISCVLCLQHMLQKGAGSYYALKGWRKKKKPKRPVRQIPRSTENTNQVTVSPRPRVKWRRERTAFVSRCY